MKKSIIGYVVKFYYKDNENDILDGIINVVPHIITSTKAELLTSIYKPEYMAMLMDKNSLYNFVVTSGTPIYNNEPKEQISANKGIIYDAIKIGIYMREKFFVEIICNTFLSFDEVNELLINAGIYFLQYSQSKEQPPKRETIINSIMYLRGLRYLKEKNINLI